MGASIRILALSHSYTSCCPARCLLLYPHKAIHLQHFTLIKGRLFATDSPALPTGDGLVAAADGGMCCFAPAVVLANELGVSAYEKPNPHCYIN